MNEQTVRQGSARVAMAGLLHESNTFLRVPTTIERFRESSLDRGHEIIERWSDAPHEWAGFIEGAIVERLDLLPLLVAQAMPSGALTSECFEELAGGIVDELRRAGPVDGVLLGLHGATVAESHPDADGEVASRVRDVVGPDVPVVVTLDCHANVSRRLFQAATVLVIYGTCPHLDQKQRGLEAASLVARIIRREITPVGALEMPPMAINITRQNTDIPPARDIRMDMQTVRERPGIVTASFALGFPYADVAEMGMSFVAYSDGDPAGARDAAAWMAQRAWDRREQYLADAMDPAEAIGQAAASETRPVVLNDIGDNVGGGSAADSTFLLEEAIRQGARGMCIVLADPQAVRACISAGVGAEVSLSVGGKTDGQHGNPVQVSGTVRIVTDGRYTEEEPRHMGMKHMSQGPTAVIETPLDHTIMLTTYRHAPASLGQLLHAGIKPEWKHMIVAKGVVLPRPAYDPIAARTILVNTAGSTTAAIEGLQYSHIRVPLFPFQRDAAYTPGVDAVVRTTAGSHPPEGSALDDDPAPGGTAGISMGAAPASAEPPQPAARPVDLPADGSPLGMVWHSPAPGLVHDRGDNASGSCGDAGAQSAAGPTGNSDASPAPGTGVPAEAAGIPDFSTRRGVWHMPYVDDPAGDSAGPAQGRSSGGASPMPDAPAASVDIARPAENGVRGSLPDGVDAGDRADPGAPAGETTRLAEWYMPTDDLEPGTVGATGAGDAPDADDEEGTGGSEEDRASRRAAPQPKDDFSGGAFSAEDF